MPDSPNGAEGDFGLSNRTARVEILEGLRATPKRLSPKYFYDAEGSRLFDLITEQPEYYPTRTEISILQARGAEIAGAIGPQAMVIEPGSGSSVKIKRLLDPLASPAAYVPVEISGEHLRAAAERINGMYPTLEVLPVCADFTRPFDLPAPARAVRRRVLFFPGSTIGNFEPAFACRLLVTWRGLLGADGCIVVGVDLVKDPVVLEAAYNDAAGVTAAFNRNMLTHLNRVAPANLDPETFEHRARFNAEHSRIEMHLVSRVAQRVMVADEPVDFGKDESIHTENSHKYTPERFAALAGDAGLEVENAWTDERGWFSVLLLKPA